MYYFLGEFSRCYAKVAPCPKKLHPISLIYSMLAIIGQLLAKCYPPKGGGLNLLQKQLNGWDFIYRLSRGSDTPFLRQNSTDSMFS